MAHSPKTPQEYQEEMMRLYREAHASDLHSMQNQSNVSSTPVTHNNSIAQQNNFYEQPNQNNVSTPESHNNSIKQQNNFYEHQMQNQNNIPTSIPNNNPMTHQNNFDEHQMQNQDNIPMPTPYNNSMGHQNNNINPLSDMQNTNNNRNNNLHNQVPLLESDFISDFPPSPSQEPTYNSDNNNYNNENANLNTSVNVSESALNSPQKNTNKSEEKGDAFGWIKIITRTGNDATPLENVAVTVTSHNGADTVLNYTTITDSSGETERIKLPAPPLTESLGRTGATPYSIYDVNVFLPGYYRQESRNVPIFPGVTSLQKFAMIPLPKYSNEFNKTIVYENDEPKFR